MKWLRRNLSTMILIMVMLAGIGLVAYPTVSDAWNRYHQSVAINNYGSSVKAMSVEDCLAELDRAITWNAGLVGRNGRLSEPQSGETWDEYNSILDIAGTGLIGYVEIPRIGARLPIYHGTGDNVLQVAAGHLYGSSFPVGGKGTHAVLSGHTGLPRAELFTGLDTLEVGDIFKVTVLDRLLTYEVDQIRVVLPEETEELRIDPDEDWCTLVTCTPYGVNSHRLLVRGTRIANLPEDAGGPRYGALGFTAYMDLYIILAAVAVTAILLTITLAVITWKRRGG